MIEPTTWAQEQFGGIDLRDARRTARLVRMAASVAASPAGTVTEVFDDDAERQGAYDLLESEHVDADALERGVGEVLGAKCAQEKHLIVVIDESTLSFSDFYGKRGLGKVGNYRADGAGLYVLSALALNACGVPLGLLRQVMWSRPRHRPKNRPSAHARPVAEKETRHWLDAIKTSASRVAVGTSKTKITYVLDRQGDCDAVLCALGATGHRFVVRCRNRFAYVGKRGALLRSLIAQRPVLGEYDVEVAGRPGRTARVATLRVRAIDVVVMMKDPVSKKKVELNIAALNAKEIGNLPPGEERLDWLVLTNQRIESFADARAALATYTLRWRIEEFHKTWKSGHCRVEESQLRGEQAVRKWALILAAVACRIERLKLLARETPNAPADIEFSENELHALILLKRRSKKKSEIIPDEVPTISQATIWLAEIGGYTGKSSGGPPGSITLSRGLFKLRAAADAIAAFLAEKKR
jgi:hypothetical protein